MILFLTHLWLVVFVLLHALLHAGFAMAEDGVQGVEASEDVSLVVESVMEEMEEAAIEMCSIQK